MLGPTATGKSAFALELTARLAERGIPTELISADALQAYRGLDIGTAKPVPRDRTRLRHHLVDVLEPHQTFSAGEFARRAVAALQEIETRGAVPLLVGGSGFYLRALLSGLAPIPAIDREVRAGLLRELETRGVEALVAELREVDPAVARSLRTSDTQRVLRALEVVRGTGRPLSSWHAEGTERKLERSFVKIGLTLPRALLYDAVRARAGHMLECGWLVEVELLKARLAPRHGRAWIELPAFQAIGYRQLAAYLDGESTLEQALEKTILATRRFAKRQQTWFRREPDVDWVDASNAGATERALERAVRAVTSAKWAGGTA